MLDILIKNAQIIDGSGRLMYEADLGIKNEIIEEIGDLQNETARQIIDAKGLFVTPGFVDVNNHSDTYWRIFSNPNLESLLFQGITTIVGGNCGSSLAPLVNQEIIKSVQKWVDIKGLNLNWLSMAEFLVQVEKKKLPVNFATLVGHGILRRGLVRDEVRTMTDREIKTMSEMLRNAMKEGAIGFSTGLVYTHAKMASEKEILALAKIVKKYNGIYTTHVRGEDGELIESIKEAINIAQKTKVRLQISHLKAIGQKNWHRMSEAISLIEEARANGLDINFDVYPYEITGSVLYVLLPDWVAEGGKKIMLQRLKNPKIRQKVVAEMKEAPFDYSKIIISISPLNKSLGKKSVVEIAKSQNKEVEEVVIDILIASEGRVVTMMDVLSSENVGAAIGNPLSIIASNGSGYSIDHKKTGELVHPRNFGAFPRILSKYVRSREVLSWEEAIHKMTGLPAWKFNLKGRGVLEKNNFADILIFDKDKIKDMATAENPYQYSRGIDWMIVNGKVVIEQGKLTGQRSGEVLRRQSKSFFGF